jgi:hypothetical protein
MAQVFMYWSPSAFGFYHPLLINVYLQAKALPTDLVPVTKDVWEMYAGVPHPAGQTLGSAGGQPTWVAIS